MRLILLSYYLVLLPVWVALIVVMMSAELDPLDTWLDVPFGLTLLTAGVHLAYFRREHVQISRRFFPYTHNLDTTLPLVSGVVLLISSLLNL